jgi:2-dehydropantoate 2-reductase
LAGVSVTAVARAGQVEVIRRKGLTIIEAGRRQSASVRAVEASVDAGQHDVVFLALKAHVLPEVADKVKPLLRPDTVVVTTCNGFPWWYFHRTGAVAPITTLQSVDPRGSLWRLIGPEHALGCVVYPAARVVETGVVEHVFGNRFALGEPDGAPSLRLKRVVAMLASAGFDAPIRQDIRLEIWTKLIANAAYNPVSVLTGATLGQLIDDLGSARVLETVMNEAASVSNSLGVRVPMMPRQLMELTRPLASHKTSTLLDFEAGRTLELEPIAGAVAELGRLRGIRTPMLDAVLGLARLRALGGRASVRG